MALALQRWKLGLIYFSDATQGVSGAADNTLAKGDAAKGDVTGSRRNNQTTTTGDGEEDPDKPKPSSLRINIKLDIDVEVHLTARVKGDITIGLL